MAAHGDNGQGDETLKDEGDKYALLSHAYIGDLHQPYLEDSFESLSGSYENPGNVLDARPYRNAARPYDTHDIQEALDHSERSSSGTLTPDYSDHTYGNIHFSTSAEEQASTLPIHPLEGSTMHTINIIGSLCLQSYSEENPRLENQGIYQGLMTGHRHGMMDVFPDALCMTVELEQHQAELEGLSVRVTRETEIVPQTQFDPNAASVRKRYSVPPDFFGTPSGLHRSPSPSPRLPTSPRREMVTYTGNVLRPTPLPPLDKSLPEKERKRYKVIESLIESEAAYLTSLNIAVKVYQNPLLEVSASTPVMDKEQIWRLFGPVEKLMDHHELFFAALSQRTKDWSPEKDIGDLFVSSFHRSEVRNNYSEYVNNFTSAMSILEKGIKKKQRFVGFLRQQMMKSSTSLSLQALLLKPIQRFMQYKLFLQDLIKFTPVSHHDRVVLQIALVNVEQTADYLNEAKRNSEQESIVHHLQTHITKLPAKLLDSCAMLVKHSVVKLVKCINGKVQMKERRLLLLDKMVICLGVKEGKKIKPDAEHVLGEITTHCLVYKWHCMVANLGIADPDHTNQDVSLAIIGNGNSKVQAKFLQLTEEMKHLDNDFQLLTKVSALVSFLHKEYEGLSQQQIDNHVSALQRRLILGRDNLRDCEAGRLDLMIPAKEGQSVSEQVHTLVFMSEKEKQDWLRSLHFIKLKQNAPNAMATWLKGDDCEEVSEGSSVHGKRIIQGVAPTLQLPLAVDYYRLNQNMTDASVECGVCVGGNRVWVASGTDESSQVTVIQCVHPAPIVIASFPIHCNRILCMKAVRSSFGLRENGLAMTTIWIGSQSGGLLVYDAMTAKCVASTRISDSALCIEKYYSRVFVGAADGNLFVFNVPKDGQWDLTDVKNIPVAKGPIRCACVVGSRLWMGVQNSCVILKMGSLKIENHVKVVENSDAKVRCLTSTGLGVWAALKRKASLYLIHKDTHKIIQEIDVRGSLEKIVQFCANKSNFSDISSLQLTSIMASAGFLWVGTSEGAILLYRIPKAQLKAPPIITSRPFLAGDGHRQPVRLLVAVETKLQDVSKASLASRFDQFLPNEQQGPVLQAFAADLPRPTSFERLADEERSRDHLEGAGSSMLEGSPVRTFPDKIEVDQSSPPSVQEIIKKLELQKTGPLSPLSAPACFPGVPPNLSESGSTAVAASAANTDELSSESATVASISEQRLSSGYDNPGNVLDRYPRGGSKSPEQPGYDSVELEFEYSIGDDNGDGTADATEGDGEEESNLDFHNLKRESTGEVRTGDREASYGWRRDLVKVPESEEDINPSRYQTLVPLLEDGGTLYSQLGTAASTLNSPTADFPRVNESVFVFSGGMGVANFRPTGGPSPLLRPERRSSVVLGNDCAENLPCVVTYQIPNVLC